MRAFFIFMVLIGLCSVSAYADDLAAMRQNLIDGQYQKIIASTQTPDTINALLIRSEALNAQLMLGLTDDDKQAAKNAMAIADRARALDPTSKDAQLLYATSYAFYGRTVSKLTAWRKKLPTKIRVEMDKALEMDPANPRIHALFGSWHLGVVHKAGAKTAKKHFDADVASGAEFFNRALSGAPGDILINANAGMMLLVSDPEVYGARAKMLLDTAKAGTPIDHLEAEVQKKAMQILEIWDDQKAAYRLAEDFLDW